MSVFICTRQGSFRLHWLIPITNRPCASLADAGPAHATTRPAIAQAAIQSLFDMTDLLRAPTSRGTPGELPTPRLPRRPSAARAHPRPPWAGPTSSPLAALREHRDDDDGAGEHEPARLGHRVDAEHLL